jgi:hypothetical protein
MNKCGNVFSPNAARFLTFVAHCASSAQRPGSFGQCPAHGEIAFLPGVCGFTVSTADFGTSVAFSSPNAFGLSLPESKRNLANRTSPEFFMGRT